MLYTHKSFRTGVMVIIVEMLINVIPRTPFLESFTLLPEDRTIVFYILLTRQILCLWTVAKIYATQIYKLFSKVLRLVELIIPYITIIWIIFGIMKNLKPSENNKNEDNSGNNIIFWLSDAFTLSCTIQTILSILYIPV